MKTFFSVKGAFQTRNLVVMALMIALKVILSQFSIYVTPTFRIMSFAYLPGAMVSMLYGPWAGLAFGFAGDIVGYLVKPMGAFFFGYTISEMAAGFLYACFLYRQPLTIWRVTLARLSILLTVTFGLNFLWNYMLMGSVASKYFTGARLINNLIQTPISIVLIFFLGQLVCRVYRPGNQAGAALPPSDIHKPNSGSAQANQNDDAPQD